jgi:uncharacterized protein YkwD
MNRHSFFTTRLASASLLFAMLAGALCVSASVANARGMQQHGPRPGAAQEWLEKYYLPLPAPGAPNSVYPDATAVSYADVIFSGVNAERVKKGLAPLKRNPHLDAVAQAHGVHMVQGKFFEHESPLGMQAAERITAAGGPDWTWVGENIAAGYQTPEIAVREWMKSKGHRKNIMNGEFVETGIGVLYDPRSYYGWYWVQVFATFDSNGQRVAWIEPQGVSPAPARAVADGSSGKSAVSADPAAEESQAGSVATGPAGKATDDGPDWIPAHPAN